MNLKKFLPLIAAVAMGLMAARIVVQLAENKKEVAAPGGPRMVTVVVAAKDIGLGQIITDSDVEDGQLAADTAPSNSFRDPSIVIGRVAATPVMKGQAVLDSLLAPKGSGSGLQAVIPNGMRAVTINVTEVSGVAGYVTAGCHVDIVQSLRSGPNGLPQARCIVQNITVAAVGPSHTTDSNDLANSVTLLVTPAQAETIELASTNGVPRLVLRGSRDQAPVEQDSVSLADLTGVSAPHGSIFDGLFKASPPAAASPQPTATAQSTKAAPTDPSNVNRWPVRVIAAGDESVVRVAASAPSSGTTVTGNGMEQTGDDQSP